MIHITHHYAYIRAFLFFFLITLRTTISSRTISNLVMRTMFVQTWTYRKWKKNNKNGKNKLCFFDRLDTFIAENLKWKRNENGKRSLEKSRRQDRFFITWRHNNVRLKPSKRFSFPFEDRCRRISAPHYSGYYPREQNNKMNVENQNKTSCTTAILRFFLAAIISSLLLFRRKKLVILLHRSADPVTSHIRCVIKTNRDSRMILKPHNLSLLSYFSSLIPSLRQDNHLLFHACSNIALLLPIALQIPFIVTAKT